MNWDLYPERSGPRYRRSDGTLTFNGWLYQRGILDDRGKETPLGWCAYAAALVLFTLVWFWLVPIMVVLVIGVFFGLPAYCLLSAWTEYLLRYLLRKRP